MTKTYGITGVASGIGAALARRLHAEGARVIGFDLVKPDTPLAGFIPLDLNNPRSIAAAAEAVGDSLDGLCNNAGVPPRSGLETTILQVNFLGQRQFTQAMLGHLRPGSAIVNMASRAGSKWAASLDQNKRLAALSGPGDLAAFVAEEGIDPTRAYNLSKEAMILWTMSLTEGLIAQDLRANSISPGAVATGILDDFARAFGDRMTRNVERAGRAGTPDEIAALAAFLLSDQSAWIKGADIPIDGGMGAFNQADAMGLDAMS